MLEFSVQSVSLMNLIVLGNEGIFLLLLSFSASTTIISSQELEKLLLFTISRPLRERKGTNLWAETSLLYPKL